MVEKIIIDAKDVHCMCSNCESLRTKFNSLYSRNEGALKLWAIFAHWCSTDKEFAEISMAAGFSPGPHWKAVFEEILDKHGYLETGVKNGS